MAENSVFMDTRVFTDIVGEIGSTTANCILSENPLGKINVSVDL